MRARTAARRHTARSSLADERRELFDSESRRFDDGTQCTAVELTVHRDSQRRSAGAFETHVTSTLARLNVSEAPKSGDAVLAGD